MMVLAIDLDGTLFDTRQDITDAVNAARRSFQLSELTLSEVTSMVGHGIAVLAQKAFRDSGVDRDLARERIMDYYALHPSDKAELYPGVRDTLPKLEAVLTVISNKPKVLVDALLDRHRLTGHFDFVAGGDTFPRKKPDPGAIEFLLDRYGVGRENVLVVGDHTPDIEMARSAGVRSVFCSYGFSGTDEVGADYRIDSFSELVGVLEVCSD